MKQKLEKISIKVDVPPGMHICEASRLAGIMALEEKSDVKFDHNGQTYTASYKDIMERVIK